MTLTRAPLSCFRPSRRMRVGAARKSPPRRRRHGSSTGATTPASVTQKRLEVSDGTATFLIDAPLEKIKGRSTKVRGSLDFDPQNLMASKGQIDFDLDDLRTETFTDVEKNKAQTGHSQELARDRRGRGREAAGREPVGTLHDQVRRAGQPSRRSPAERR